MQTNLKSYGNLPITLWMNMPSHYQDDLIHCLNEVPGVDLSVVYDSEIAPYRRDMGWRAHPPRYRHMFLSGRKTLNAVRMVLASRDSIHIFNGIWAVPSFAAALLAHLARPGPPCFVYSEVPSRSSKRTSLRRGLRDALGRIVARNRRCRVLAVSRMAEEFYGSLGFAGERVYPFAYFRDSGVPPQVPRPGGLRLVFVGILEPRKGLDVLIEALEPLWGELPNLSVDLIGGGPLLPILQQYQSQHPEARIRLRGTLSSSEVSSQLAGCDLLVLPSRADGWGVVVNEGLAVGLPALVSDACGSADVIHEGRNGFVVPSGDATAMRSRVLAFAAKTQAERIEMSDLAAAAGKSLQPRVAVQYLLECVRHTLRHGAKPVAPWMLNHEPVLHS